MSKKIYISPSDQNRNIYATGNTNEMVQCQKIGKALASALVRCGFEAKSNDTDEMEERVAESNAWGANLHVCIHTNAFNGEVKGTRMFSYDTSGEGYQACKQVMATLSPITPGKSDNITAYPGLYEVRNAEAPTVYIEVAFHDNKEEAAWIIAHTDDIAEAICEGVCNHYKVKYIPHKDEKPATKDEKPVTKDYIYRVFDAAGKQVGAYGNESNAFNAVKKQLQTSGKASITYGER